MKLSNANAVRSILISDLFKIFAEKGEDVGMIASNSFNFPIVKNGEEGWVEIVVKVTKDDGDDGYGKREEYEMKRSEREEKAKVSAEKKAKKIAKDKAEREKRKAEKEEA